MLEARFKFVAGILIASAVVAQNTNAEGPRDDAKMKEVKASDLTRSIEIISDLGYPLQKIVKVRGRWRERPHTKDQELGFLVTHIEGKAIEPKVEILSVDIRPFKSHGTKEDGGADWDWSAASKERREPPKPAAGEEWEMRIVGQGEIVGFRKEVWNEIGLAVQDPHAGHFVPTYYFISVRRLEKAPGK